MFLSSNQQQLLRGVPGTCFPQPAALEINKMSAHPITTVSQSVISVSDRCNSQTVNLSVTAMQN